MESRDADDENVSQDLSCANRGLMRSIARLTTDMDGSETAEGGCRSRMNGRPNDDAGSTAIERPSWTVTVVEVWKRLSRDWQAVVLGALVVVIAFVGVSIPW